MMKKSVFKKVLSITLTLIIAAVFTMPAETVYAASNTKSVSSQSQLISALNNVKTSAKKPAVIVVGKNIKLTQKITVPEGKYIELKGRTGKERIYIASKKKTEDQKSETSAMFMVAGNLTVSRLTLDANKKMRTVTVLNGGCLKLNNKAVVTGGALGDVPVYNGAGVNVKSGSVNQKGGTFIMNKGSEVKGNTTTGGYGYVNGIGVFVGSYCTFTMNGGSIHSNIDKTKRNYSFFSYGGGVYAAAVNGKVTINGGTISKNIAKGGGGGIQLANNAITMTGGSITGNKTNIMGGGVNIDNSCIFNLKGGKISNNTANGEKEKVTGVNEHVSGSLQALYGCGGGICLNGTNSVLNMTGGSITGNKSITKLTANTAESYLGQGGGVMVCGTFNMKGGIIKSNSANTNKKLAGIAGSGGGVSVSGGYTGGTFNMSGGSITGNKAGNNGGGVYFNNRYIDGSIFLDSTLATYKGVGTFEVSGKAKIYGNTVKSGNKDNVYLPKEGKILVTGEMKASSKVLIDTAVFSKGHIMGDGYEDYTLTPDDAKHFLTVKGAKHFALNKDGKLYYKGSTHSGKSVSSADVEYKSSYEYTGKRITPDVKVSLGGTALKEGRDYIVSYHSCINVGKAKLVIYGNGSYAGKTSKTYEIKKADIAQLEVLPLRDKLYTGKEVRPQIKIYNGKEKLVENKDYSVSFSDNIEKGTGKAYISGEGNYQGSLQLEFNITDSSNSVIVRNEEELQKAVSEGGTIYVYESFKISSTITVPSGKSVTIKGEEDNVVLEGDRLGVASKGMFDVSGSLVLEDITVDAGKGSRVVYIEKGGKLNLNTGSIIKNGFSLKGAGVYNEGTAVIDGGSIINSTTKGLGAGKGGGIYNAGTLTIDSGDISENESSYGGSIYNAGTLKMNSGSVANSNAVYQGGGICNDGTAELNGGSIEKNRASKFVSELVDGKGGGIYNTGSISIAGCSITENSAAYQGGGIYDAGATVMSSGSISGNSTENSLFQYNSACGGGVYIASGNFTVSGGEITGNKACSKFVSDSYAGTLGCGGGIFVSNESDSEYSATGLLTVKGGNISGNSAESALENENAEVAGCGGGIYVQGGSGHIAQYYMAPAKASVSGIEIKGNRAGNKGAGLYVSSVTSSNVKRNPWSSDVEGAEVTMSGSVTISDNGSSNVYLEKSALIKISGSLLGRIGIASGASGNVVIASGNSGSSVFYNEEGRRTVAAENGNIYLKGLDLTDKRFTAVLEKTEYVYTGSPIQAKVKIKDSSSLLKENTDYTLDYNSNITDVGTKEVTISGLGDYGGSITLEYNVVKADIAKASVKIPAQKYTGKAINLIPAAGTITYKNRTLLRGTDYTINQDSYTGNTKIGTASFVITGKGNFKGNKKITFKIVK